MKKMIIVLFSVLINSCSQKITELNYYRPSTKKQETLLLNFKKNIFVYSAEVESEKFVASGIIERNERSEGLTLVFPAYSETNKLSPFEKGYSEIIKIDSSDQIVIELSVVDLKSNLSLIQVRSSLLSSIDSTELESFDSKLILLEGKNTENILRVAGGTSYYSEELKIPGAGRYKFNVYLQPIETTIFYELTTEGCYPISTSPRLYTFPCEIENDTVKILGLDRDCDDVFLLAEELHD